MSDESDEQKSFETAVYISENHGNEIPEELLKKLADTANIPFEMLLEDYRNVSKINKIVNDFDNANDN